MEWDEKCVLIVRRRQHHTLKDCVKSVHLYIHSIKQVLENPNKLKLSSYRNRSNNSIDLNVLSKNWKLGGLQKHPI